MSSFVPCTAWLLLALPLHLPMAVLGSLIPNLLLPPLVYEMALLVLSAATQFTQQTKTHQTKRMAQSQGYAICVWYSVQMEVRRQLARVPSPLPHPIVDSRDWTQVIGLGSKWLPADPSCRFAKVASCLCYSLSGRRDPVTIAHHHCRPGLPLLLRALRLASSDFIMRNTGVGREP